MDDLEQQPETSFEMDVMCEDEEAFCLSDDNIAALKMLLGQVRGFYFPPGLPRFAMISKKEEAAALKF